jgi:hypothetical protein
MTRGSTPDAPGVDSRLTVLLSYAVLLAGLSAGIASAYIVISTYSPLPHWDEWALFDHLATGNAWSLTWLWAQHNEHRIFVTKLLFLIDVQFFHGTQIFLLTSIFLVQLLQAALLSFSLWTLGHIRGSAWRVGTGLIAYCILCPTQQENLIWGFQSQFVIPAAMATLSILSLLMFCKHATEQRRVFLWISIAAAAVATWSLANGMLLWAILLLVVILLREKLSTILLLIAVAAANVSLYFFHYHRPTPESDIAISSRSVVEILRYIAVYLGSTWVRHSSGWLAVVLGTIGICAGLITVLRVLRQRGTRSMLMFELSLLMLLCILTATITASGRLHLGLEQATASRYQTFALLFWCSLGLALMLQVSRNPAKLNLFSAFLLALMLGFATQVRLPLIDAQWHQHRLTGISQVLLTGVHDPAVLADGYPDPQVVLRAAQYMREHRLSIFAGDTYSRLGQPLDNVYRLAPASECSGYISSAQVLPADDGPGLRIMGYAWDRESSRPASKIIAAVGGRIAGYGSSVSISLARSTTDPQGDPARFGWVAFVRDATSASQAKIYAVIGNGSKEVCQFAQPPP